MRCIMVTLVYSFFVILPYPQLVTVYMMYIPLIKLYEKFIPISSLSFF